MSPMIAPRLETHPPSPSALHGLGPRRPRPAEAAPRKSTCPAPIAHLAPTTDLVLSISISIPLLKSDSSTTTSLNTTLPAAEAQQQLRVSNGQLQAVTTTTSGGGPQPPISIWQRLWPLTRAGEAYARAQRARPWTTQVATSLLIYLCADLSAQRMSTFTTSSPSSSSSSLSSATPTPTPTPTPTYDPWRTARTLLIGGAAAIPGHLWFGVPGAVVQLRGTAVAAGGVGVGVGAAGGGGRVWPAVTALSFACLAPGYRPAFAGVVAVAWQTYLSCLNRREEEEEEEKKRLGQKKGGEGHVGGGGVSKGVQAAAGVLIREGAVGRSMVA
ncbi:hypothetical protein F4809DRAFT_664620 [Biscogniauxia mediterranea]|nr:hypothetical protein F4809DRAFT_664620 [Biscogniauxia mediterranea]